MAHARLAVIPAIVLHLFGLGVDVVAREPLPYEWSPRFYEYKFNLPATDNGYTLVAKDPLLDVDPLRTPKVSDKVNLWGFGCQGQFVPMSFVIYAQKELKKVSVVVSQLTCEKTGTTIGKERVELRTGMRQARRRTHSSSVTDYRIVTRFLPKFQPFDLPMGTFREVYLLIAIPKDAKAGKYRGKVKVSPENAPPSDVDIVLEVLPFHLAKAPKKYGMYYHLNDALFGRHYAKQYDLKTGEKRVRLELAQMRDYQAADALVLDCGIKYVKSGEEIVFSYDEVRTALDLLRQGGLTRGQVVVRTRFEELANLLGHKIIPNTSGGETLGEDKRFYALAKEALLGLKKVQEDYPEFEIILSHYSDEIDTPPRDVLFVELTKPIRQLPEFKVYVTFHTTYGPWKIERLEKMRKIVAPFVDVRGNHGVMFEWWRVAGGTFDEYQAETGGRGEDWCYYNPIAVECDAHWFRIVNGLAMWLNPVFSAHVSWTYFYGRRGSDDPYDDFAKTDDGKSAVGFSFPSWGDRITPVPTREFEGWREGVYDIRYFATLSEFIERFKGTKPKQAKQTQEWLAEVARRFPALADLTNHDKEFDVAHPEESRRKAPFVDAAVKRLSSDDLWKIRYTTTAHIIALME